MEKFTYILEPSKNIPFKGEIYLKNINLSQKQNLLLINEVVMNLDYFYVIEDKPKVNSYIDYFYDKINSYIKSWIDNIKFSANKIKITINNKFKITLELNKSELDRNNDRINIKCDLAKLIFTKNNYLLLDNLNLSLVLEKNNINVDKCKILNMDLYIEPLFIYFLNKYKNLSNTGDKNNHKFKVNRIVIDVFHLHFMKLKYLAINITVINLEEITISNQSLYQSNESYLKLSNMSCLRNKISIGEIDITINPNIYLILIESFNHCLPFFPKSTKNEDNSSIDMKIINDYERKNVDLVNDDYILIDNEISNTPQQKISYMIYIKKIKLQFQNEFPILNLELDKVKIIDYQDTSQYFRIENLYIRDLTEKKWDYILYKKNNSNFIEISLKHLDKVNYDYYDLYIRCNDLVLNIDQYFLEALMPLINELEKFIPRITGLFPAKLMYIQETVFRSYNLTISYKPRGLNFIKILKGETSEFLNLGSIHDFQTLFPEVRIRNSFTLGETISEVLLKQLKTFEKRAIYFILKNEKLKMFMFPITNIDSITLQNDYKKYLKNISIDVLELFRKGCNNLEQSDYSIINKPSHIFKKSIIYLQNKLDKSRKNGIVMKYKNSRY